jgi:hypothetical protein
MELIKDSKYFEPLDLHEDDSCIECHKIHRENGEWIHYCYRCEREKPCSKCGGIGWYDDNGIEDSCPQCRGTGRELK